MGTISIVLIIFFVYILYDFIYKKLKYNNIKGLSTTKPIVGDLFDLRNETHLLFQKHSQSKLYNSGKYIKYWFCDLLTIGLFDVDLIREIYIKNADAVNSRAKTPMISLVGNKCRGIVTANEVYWKFHREIVQLSFTGRKVKTLSSSIEKETSDLISYMSNLSKSEQPFLTRTNFMNFNSNIVFDYVFTRHIDNIYDGVNLEQLKVLDAIKILFESFATFHIWNFLSITQPFYYLSKRLFGHPSDTLKNILKKYYREHCETIDLNNPRDVLDSIIIEYRKVGGKEEEASVIAMGNELILAGVETNSTTMEWFTLTLCNRPDYQEKLYSELSSVSNGLPITIASRSKTPLFNATLKEVLRLYPPVPFSVGRETIRPINIDNVNGVKLCIPKGAHLLQSLYSIQRDEVAFPEPNQFKPERWLQPTAEISELQSKYYFPYGIGVRSCVGMAFSQDELYTLLSNLVLNFKILPEIENTKIDDTPIFGFSFKPKEFKVILKSR